MIAADFIQALPDVCAAVWRASWQASVLAVLVFGVQLAFGRRIPARWRHTMWLLVLVRLALPVVPSSPLSVFNLAPQAQPASPAPTLPPVFAKPTPVAEHSNIPRNVGMSAPGAPAVRGVATPAAPATPPSPSADQHLWAAWPQVLAACWLGGAGLLALRIAWATLRVSRMMRKLDRVDDPAVLQLLRETAGELRVRRLPVLLTGGGFFNPALVGFVRPRLLLPADLLQRFEAAELRLVLLHELAHLKRRDVAINWLATLLTMLHWPNPFAWLVAWRLRLERELACDELVMSVAPADADRRAYGHTIVKLLETLSRAASSRVRPMPGAVGILEGKQQMKRRITMIAQFTTRARAWTIVAGVLVLGLGAVALTDAQSVERPPTDKKPPAPAAAAAKPASGSAPAEQTADYVLGPGDLIQVTVFDLEGPGLQTLKSVRVSESGTISMPYLKEPVKVAGFTAADAQRELAKAYKKSAVLDNANLTVDVVEPTNQKATIGANELVTVSIMDLVAQGVETVKTSRVDADGNINLPYVGAVKAKGLRSGELEKAVAKSFNEKGVLERALVVVSLPGRGESHALSNRADRADKAAAQPAVEMLGDAHPFRGQPMAIDPAIAAQLDKKLPEVTFEGVGLSDVIDFLRDVTAANVFVDWRALEEAGVDRNAPVTARLRDVAFKNALALILRGVHRDLYYNVENNVIQIGVNAPAENEKLVVQAYDVSDVLGEDVKGPDRTARITELMSAMKVPLSGDATMSTFGTKVVVRASEADHKGVERVLKLLREQPATRPAATK